MQPYRWGCGRSWERPCPLVGERKIIHNGVSRTKNWRKGTYPAWLGRTPRRWVIAGGVRSTRAKRKQPAAEGKPFLSAYGTRSGETREQQHAGVLWLYYLFNMCSHFSSSDEIQEGQSSSFPGTALADTNWSPSTELCSCRVLRSRVGFFGVTTQRSYMDDGNPVGMISKAGCSNSLRLLQTSWQESCGRRRRNQTNLVDEPFAKGFYWVLSGLGLYQ